MSRQLVEWLGILVIGVIWGAAMTYSHAVTFAEYLCRNCACRSAEAKNPTEDDPDGR